MRSVWLLPGRGLGRWMFDRQGKKNSSEHHRCASRECNPMANALVVRKTHLPRSTKSVSAAQYVRMSTDHQRYSIPNQAAAIAPYATSHNLTIVRTYTDRGESGLQIKNRSGLIELLDDVGSGRA